MNRTALVCAAVAVSSLVAGAQGMPAFPVRDPHAAGFVAAVELKDGVLPSPAQDGNFVVGPTHVAAVETKVNASVPHGTVLTFTMASAGSAYYPGLERDGGEPADPLHAPPANDVTTHAAAFTRTVTVYVPAQYVAGAVAPFVVGEDGPDRELFVVLDNLIAAHKVPVMVAISIGSGVGHGEGSERGYEYDTASGKYAEFVEHEVLPLVESHAHVTLTHDPDGRAAIGMASGGAASFGMAWFHPELYHRVVSFEGTFINQQWPPDPALPDGPWEYHARLIPSSPVKPIRVWLDEGDRDLIKWDDPKHDWVIANEHMAAALQAKGYHYQFVFARGAGPNDAASKSQLLPEALEYVWRGYVPR